MVDDHTQRPYRSNDTIARGAPAKPPEQGNRSASDPLAELARLIGQNDPFAEFGRDGARRAPAPLPAEQPALDWSGRQGGAAYSAPQAPQPPQALPPDPHPPAPVAREYYEPAPVAPVYGRQAFGGAPLSTGNELYHVEPETPGYAAHQAADYNDDPYHQHAAQHAAEDDDYYDDAPPSRRRMGIMVIAGVFALAVIGTAGAFGYRAMFGSSSSAATTAPRVIKADTTPSKVVPAVNTDSQSNKQITDRINDRGIGEKLVSREEQPVDFKDKTAGGGIVYPQGPAGNQMPLSNANAAGTGAIGSEPKKIRTITIRPDQQASADAMPAAAALPQASAPAAGQPAPRVVNITPAKQPAPSAPDDSGPAPAAARVAPRVAAAPAPASANAPLSLSPDTAPSAPARAAPPPRAAAVAATHQASAAGGGSYGVQVSAQRSEAEAQAAFRSLQGKYPAQLGGKQAVIRKADLGDKGVYYRAVVPFSSNSEAAELCTSLKSAGGSCIIQRN